MITPIRVLIVEDREDDAELLLRVLRRGGFAVTHQRVETREDMAAALEHPWDMVISDWVMPNFSGMDALSLVKESEVDVPLLIVSGTIGEETAVQALKSGAQDFLLKGQFARLIPAVERELRDAATRREVRKIEAYLKDAIESISEGFVIFDVDDRLVMSNAKYKGLVKRRAETLEVGAHFEDLLREGIKNGNYPQARNREEEWVQERIQAHRKPGEAIEVQLADGRWLLLTDRRMQTGGVAGLRIDITAQKVAQEKLRQSETMLQIAGQMARLGGWAIDVSERRVICSDQVAAILGLPPGASVSLQESIRFPAPEWRDKISTALSACIRDAMPFDEEFEIITAHGGHGHRLWVRSIARAVRDADGRIARVEGAFQDITEKKKAENNMRQLQEQLHQAQRLEAVGQLTGGVAHDFNNLLGVIIGNLDILRELRNEDSETRELAGEALDAALRGADLTRQLLAFARRQPLRPQRIDVNECVTGITRLLRRTLGERIEILLELAPAVWPVLVDPAQLEASLMNLATNARDAMPNGGRLKIVSANRRLDADYAAQQVDVTAGDYVMIEVSDSGTGMPPEVVNRIFEPFFTTKGRDKGTGLGLSMLFGYMKQSGGHVNVYSEVGLGTTFRLYLPRLQLDVRAEEKAPLRGTAFGHGETVLAVEDNAALRRVVARQLQELGYRPIEAENSAAALRVLEREPVDLLFSDVVMPGEMTGIDLARTVLTRWPDVRVILTSGFPEMNPGGNLGSPAGVRMLTKPYRKEELARTLREALEMGRR